MGFELIMLRTLCGRQPSARTPSDEALCERWVENPYFQLFCGEEFFPHWLSFDRLSLARSASVSHHEPWSVREVGKGAQSGAFRRDRRESVREVAGWSGQSAKADFETLKLLS